MASKPPLRTSSILWMLASMSQSVFPASPAAQVVVLGSGTPIPDPRSSGPAVAVVVHGRAYLFDAGAGVVRRAEEAAERHHLPALEAQNLSRLFLTHLHADHTLGLPDLILTPWIVGRRQALEIYGPKGTAAMTGHLKEAYGEDIGIRSQGLEHLDLAGLQVNVHEISAGPVYSDPYVAVRAIPVRHGSWPQAFGFAIEAAGRKIVLSGDTARCPAIEEACQGCDVLVHEVYSAAGAAQLSSGVRRYHSGFHTSTRELAAIAGKCKPKLLVLYHQMYFGAPEDIDLEKEIRESYSGTVVSSRDLGVY